MAAQFNAKGQMSRDLYYEMCIEPHSFPDIHHKPLQLPIQTLIPLRLC